MKTMFVRRSTALTLAFWLGMFMAFLMPWHACSHCETSHQFHGQSELGESHGGALSSPDLCSICKGLSHLSLVHAQAGAGDLYPTPTYAISERILIKSVSGFLAISPRSPPLV